MASPSHAIDSYSAHPVAVMVRLFAYRVSFDSISIPTDERWINALFGGEKRKARSHPPSLHRPAPSRLRAGADQGGRCSPLDLKTLRGDQDNIGENLRSHMQAFSSAVRDNLREPGKRGTQDGSRSDDPRPDGSKRQRTAPAPIQRDTLGIRLRSDPIGGEGQAGRKEAIGKHSLK